MPLAKYIGNPKNREEQEAGGLQLGRHDFVKLGQTIELTDAEAAMVANDPRFEIQEAKPRK